MRVDYISDLHIDFWVKELNPEHPKFKRQFQHFIHNVLRPRAGEVLIIAGDLGHYEQQDKFFLLEMRKYYKNVILVKGNHDMYLISNKIQNKFKHNSHIRIQDMKDWAANQPGIHYLDGETIEINGFKFAGTGMSWDTSFYKKLNPDAQIYHVMELFNNVMNDSRLIFEGEPRTRIQMAYGSYEPPTFDALSFFDNEYEKLQKIEHVDVMISHYGPVVSPDIPEEYKNDEVSTFYYFDGSEEVLRINPQFWIYGHTHHKTEFTHGSTHLMVNPLGYPGENTYNYIRSFDIF